MTQRNYISVLNVIPAPILFFRVLLNVGHELGEVDYCIGIIIRKVNILLTGLILLKHSLWKYFQWNPHASFTLFKYVYYLYLLLFKVMVAVSRYLVSVTKYLFVNHSGISFVDFLGGLPLEPFTLYLQYLCISPLFPHLLQITFVISYDPHIEPLKFPMFRIFNSTCLKILLNEHPIITNLCLQNQVLILRILLYDSRFPQLLMDKYSVFTHILL